MTLIIVRYEGFSVIQFAEPNHAMNAYNEARARAKSVIARDEHDTIAAYLYNETGIVLFEIFSHGH